MTMAASDIVGLGEDIIRQKAIMETTVAEFNTLITKFDEFYTDVFLPAEASFEGNAEIKDDVIAKQQMSLLSEALRDVKDYTDIDTLNTVLTAFYALSIFDPAIYTTRVDEVAAAAQARADEESA